MITAAFGAASADAARPSDAEAIARVEESLGGPIAGAAPEALAQAVGGVISSLPPQEIQYSIDIVGAVAQVADPEAATAAAEAARSAVADAAAANPAVIEEWWAELIDDSIAMVAGEAGPLEDAGPSEGDAATAPAPVAEADAAEPDVPELAETEPELPPPATDQEAADQDVAEASDPATDDAVDDALPLLEGDLETDLALSTDLLTDPAPLPELAPTPPRPVTDDPVETETDVAAAPVEEAEDPATADTAAAEEAGPPEATESIVAVDDAQPCAATASVGAVDEAVEPSDDAGQPAEQSVVAVAPDPAPEVDQTILEDEPSLPTAPAEAAGGTDIAMLPPPESDPVVSRMLNDFQQPGAVDPRDQNTIRIVGPAPDVPVAVDQMLRSFDGIVELVEFWLQKPIAQASTIELARAVQATVLMLPPDSLSSASSVAGAIAAVVPDAETVDAVTRAAETGVQVKVSRDPVRYDSAEVDRILVAIGRATGNVGGIQPAAGGFVPGPTAAPETDFSAFDEQDIDPGS